MTDFVVKDSGQRHAFSSGMVRDTTEGKVDYELVFNGPMLDRWAAHLTKGAQKYPDVEPGVPNWTLANGREELVRFRKSAVRHFRQWLRGDTDEDHASAVFFNINGFEKVKTSCNQRGYDHAQSGYERTPTANECSQAANDVLEVPHGHGYGFVRAPHERTGVRRD